MTQGANAGTTDQVQASIVARPVGRESVLTVVGAGPEGRGPWSFVTGIPNPGFDMVGPPPQYLSVAAWAA